MIVAPIHRYVRFIYYGDIRTDQIIFLLFVFCLFTVQLYDQQKTESCSALITEKLGATFLLLLFGGGGIAKRNEDARKWSPIHMHYIRC